MPAHFDKPIRAKKTSIYRKRQLIDPSFPEAAYHLSGVQLVSGHLEASCRQNAQAICFLKQWCGRLTANRLEADWRGIRLLCLMR